MLVILFLLGMLLMVPLHFRSLEHIKLREKYGEEKGKERGAILGMISGWGFFGFWIGVWIAPQPQFIIPLFDTMIIQMPVINLAVPIVHLIIALAFLLLGAWLGIVGVMSLGLEVSEKHQPRRVITEGPYSHMRHPQYLGGILAHIGVVFLLSAGAALLFTPIIVLVNYLMCRKEEQELIHEFGDEYFEYQRRVPMLPFFHRKSIRSNGPESGLLRSSDNEHNSNNEDNCN